MKMRGKNYIKVVSVILLIAAAIAVLTYTIGGLLLSAGTIATGESAGWIVVGLCVVYTILGVLQAIAGVKGIKGCDKREAIDSLRKWGMILMVVSIISAAWQCVGTVMQGEDILNGVAAMLFSILLPGLYLYGVKLNQES